MKISEVVKLTGLTKKALYYYEEEGMISPYINVENSYREYSQSDIDKLVQISLLRQLEVPIKNVKLIINDSVLLKDVLNQHLTKLNENIEKLKKNKKIIQSCLQEVSNESSTELTNKLLYLKKSLEMDQFLREDFMRKHLHRIFPGTYGKMIFYSCGVFLNESIDADEKTDAWIEMINLLDSAHYFDYTNYTKAMIQNFEHLSDKKLERISFETRKWVSITNEEMIQEKEKCLKSIDALYADPNLKLKRMQLANFLKSAESKETKFDVKFNNNLITLSKDYTSIFENRSKFEKLLSTEHSIQEFFKSHDIEIRLFTLTMINMLVDMPD